MAISTLFDVTDKRFVITGSTSGIGLNVARGLLELGAKVVVTSRKEANLAEVEAELSKLGDCIAIRSDISTEDGCRALAEEVGDRYGEVDVLVNNAAVTWGAPLEEHDAASWSRVYDTNVAGAFHCTKFFRPLLEAASTPDDPARVITFSSAAGVILQDSPTYSYTSSKAAIIHLTRHLAKDLAPSITVNCIVPGPFHSRMMKKALEDGGTAVAAQVPMRRIGVGDDMIGAVVYLSSAASTFVTGIQLAVDGGVSNCVTAG